MGMAVGGRGLVRGGYCGASSSGAAGVANAAGVAGAAGVVIGRAR